MSSPDRQESSKLETASSVDTDTTKIDPTDIQDSVMDRTKTDNEKVEDDAQDILAAAPDVEVDLENGDGTELKRDVSSVVPRAKRRGLLSQFVIGVPEIEDPVQYPKGTKNFIVFIIAIAATAAPMG